MNRPLLRAEGVIFSSDFNEVLVQCDVNELFYRFPGGSIEWNETGNEAIARELIEEFDLNIVVKQLFVINEALIEYEGTQQHQCTIFHLCELPDGIEFIELQHKEASDIRLRWKSITELATRPLYPEGMLEIIKSMDFDHIRHIISRKIY